MGGREINRGGGGRGGREEGRDSAANAIAKMAASGRAAAPNPNQNQFHYSISFQFRGGFWRLIRVIWALRVPVVPASGRPR